MATVDIALLKSHVRADDFSDDDQYWRSCWRQRKNM